MLIIIFLNAAKFRPSSNQFPILLPILLSDVALKFRKLKRKILAYNLHRGVKPNF